MHPSPANPSPAQPPLRAVVMSLFPTLGSLNEVMALAESKLPITNTNELHALLFTYHNTLIQELQKGAH